MSDKSQNSHIERTVYVQPDTTPGSSVHYGSWEDSIHHASRCRECFGLGTVQDRVSWRDVRCAVCRGSGRVTPLPLTIIELATGSDYSGSLVEISNMRCLKRDFPWLVEIYGGYGTRGLGYLGRRENQSDALIEAIDGLTEYPLFDEDDHSDLETETAAEAWESDGRDDFKRALIPHFDIVIDDEHEHDLDDESHNEAIDQLWQDLVEIFRGGEDHLNEQGDAIYFPVYQLFKQIADPRFASYLDKGPYGGERPSVREQMQTLAVSSRITNSGATDNV